ncbi:hypothetical protein IMG5_073080 [Ichthyophthirius multifiliis]|uniref:alpha-mannosidase n=1 Tax=Ichthyophthirius multifiliis TaxID=5932 RepID=G0QPY6_ICHMU|nr:hypothetical protein IMG5_073080 [Ichthyophthirius multifiliis]EGR32713.1 hypothetical protein IMG5_073080 [Ichthyophthirius multifiliis]|eukprot:XP_004036699.1 hypothetical protein IMG5_073080 [Ichthyophthirius multifiliis]
MSIYCFLFLFFVQITFQIRNYLKNNNQTLYIHLIPHSHDDVGWLKTVDEYYYGSNQSTQWAGVQYTIDTVLDELLKDKNRKFIQVEIAFLYRWWNDSPEERQKLYKKLVENGQIEFVNAGWCMHDESTPYYEDMIDNMTIGHQWILQTFNKIPTVGWHVDPFGHSSTNAALFSQMGFNGWWFGRVDYQDKAKRLREKQMEMIWRPKLQSQEDDNYIFSSVTYANYYPPEGFNFDLKSDDEPIMSNKQLEGYNLDKKSDQFVEYFKNMSLFYKSRHLMHTLGGDFHFANAIMTYKNMDKIIKYVNENIEKYNVEILYSTPSIYLEEIYKLNITFPQKIDDFLPYADEKDAYWTGYFTSRVAVKGYVRQSGRYLQQIRNLFSIDKMLGKSKYLKDNYIEFQSKLDSLEQNMAILQHHDAVAGTEKQKVADDYQYRIYNSTQKLNEVLHKVVQEYVLKDIQEDIRFSQCNWNITSVQQCQEAFQQFQNGNVLLLNTYNPSVQRNITLRLRVPNIPFYIIDNKNNYIEGERVCYDGACDLYFVDYQNSYQFNYYKFVPFKISPYNVKNIQKQHMKFFKLHQVFDVSRNISLQVNRFNTQFQLNTFTNSTQNCTKNAFEVLYNYYNSYQGDGQKSGAYIFRPDNNNIDRSQTYSKIKNKYIFNGKLVTIVILEGTKIKSELRVYPNLENVIELQTYVKSIPVDDKKGKEVVLLINTNLNTNQTFYTDSNGLELQKRVINQRETWDLQVNQPSSCNYYPVNGIILIQDVNSQERISVVNDRSQGGTSLQNGQIEIMIHRRTLMDDNRGVGEALNETERIDQNKGLQQILRHYIVFENGNENLSRKIQNYIDSQSIVFYGNSQEEYFKDFLLKIDSLKDPLNINNNPYLKVYFRVFGDDYLLRLNNLNDNENAQYFIHENIEIIDELTLTGNQKKKDWKQKQYKWKVEGVRQQFNQEYIQDKYIKQGYINVKPLQLRAFRVRFIKNEEKYIIN